MLEPPVTRDEKDEQFERLFSAGFTQSEISMWDECAQKWCYKYYMRLDKPGLWSWPLAVGHLWHYLIEQGYKYDKWTDPVRPDFFDNEADKNVLKNKQWREKANYWIAIMQVLRDAYYRQHRGLPENFKAIEVTLKAKFAGFLFTGKADLIGIVAKESALLDFKTCKQFSDKYDQGWEFKFQFLYYIWLYYREFGDILQKFIIRMVRKGSLRQGKEESLEAFTLRQVNDITNNEDSYFKDYAFPVTQELLENFEKYVIFPKIQRIQLLQANPKVVFPIIAANRNTNACFNYGSECEYLSLCKFGINKEMPNYTIRDIKHKELE